MNNDSSYELPKGRKVEVITSVQRRRRWAPAEKKLMLKRLMSLDIRSRMWPENMVYPLRNYSIGRGRWKAEL